MTEKFPYEDIIDLPPYTSKKYPQPSMEDRAARFSPFAAVTGYEEMVQEQARVTDVKMDLDDSEKEKISDRLNMILQFQHEEPIVRISYFVPNSKKDGGSYREEFGKIKAVDPYSRLVIMQNGSRIRIDDIVSVDGELFDEQM